MIVVAHSDSNCTIGSEFERVLNKVHENEFEPPLIANYCLDVFIK